MATRILAHLGLLAPEGRVALTVGSDVVYLAGRGVAVTTMTPYDVAAVRLSDCLDLAGVAPADADRYLSVLRARVSARAAALTAGGEMLAAADLLALVESLARISWAEAESGVRASGGLIGAYPSPAEDR